MNLLIEQRPTTITSSKLHQQQSQISNQNDMNNSLPSSPLVLKIKRHTTKQQQQQQNDIISTLSHMGEDDNSRSTPPNQRLKRTISNTTTRRPSSPAFNGKQQQQQQQSSKRSVTIDNNNNDLTSNIEDISATKRFKRDDLYQSPATKVDASVETVSIGLATEPDHLGPCEPGTSVVLEGIVWNETDNGVLVVNVTWRGKTYVGTLLDSTKQDWACPRLTCESPTSDYDPRINTSKTNRTTKRTNTSTTTTTTTGGNHRCSNHQSISSFQQITSNIIDDRKLRNNIKSRQSKRLNNLNEDSTTNSSPLTSPFRTNQTFFSSESTTILEPQLIPCSESQCHKRFASNLALTYHISNAHKKCEQPSPTITPQANTRDEEDVAHILANVADYVRRSSPRCSPEHQQAIPNSPPSILTWPCPQISSKLVLSSPLNNTERTISPTRCNLHYSSINSIDHQNSVKSADHFLLHIQDEPVSIINKNSSSPSYLDSSKKDRNNNKKRSKILTPPPLPLAPPISSSPAYSDISDEDPTISNEQILPLSTINLLTATNGKMDENGHNLHSSSSLSSSFLPTNGGLNNSDLSNPAWTTQMLFQQLGPLMQQQALVAAAAESITKNGSTTPNRLNSKNNCPSSNGTSDSTVKNILDGRRSSTTKSSSAPPPLPPTTLYHYHPNETKFSPSMMNTLTSPNENLLHPSATTIKPIDILDYSLNTNRGQYHHSSR